MPYVEGSPPGGDMVAVAFDLRASSLILEELTKRGDVEPYTYFIGLIKRHINSAAMSRGMMNGWPWFYIYKFVRDGWILLFPTGVLRPGDLLGFMRTLAVLHGSSSGPNQTP